MTLEGIKKAPEGSIIYVDQIDRYILIRRHQEERTSITWLSKTSNLQYGGVGASGWPLSSRARSTFEPALKRGFVRGWDESIWQDNVNNNEKTYNVFDNKILVIPKSILTI